jgi:FkbM family methyltransferase
MLIKPTVARVGSSDEPVWKDLFFKNEYRMPESLGPDDVVVDIGAHVGAFSFMSLYRNAGRCYAYEADPLACKIAAVNLHQFGKRSILRNRVVWGIPRKVNFVTAEANENTGIGRVWDWGGTEYDAIGIQEILDEAPKGVSLLKLNCNGAEWSILAAADLQNVSKVIGVLHENFVSRVAANECGVDPDRDWLRARLEGQGFVVETLPIVDNEKMSFFFASR